MSDNILRFTDFNIFKYRFKDILWFVYETEEKFVLRVAISNVFIGIYEYIKGDPNLDLQFGQLINVQNVIHVAPPEDLIEEIEETVLDEEVEEDG